MRTRKERLEGRKHLMAMAARLYKPGDDAVELGKRMETEITRNTTIKPETKAFLLELLKTLLPIIIRLFIL